MQNTIQQWISDQEFMCPYQGWFVLDLAKNFFLILLHVMNVLAYIVF